MHVFTVLWQLRQLPKHTAVRCSTVAFLLSNAQAAARTAPVTHPAIGLVVEGVVCVILGVEIALEPVVRRALRHAPVECGDALSHELRRPAATHRMYKMMVRMVAFTIQQQYNMFLRASSQQFWLQMQPRGNRVACQNSYKVLRTTQTRQLQSHCSLGKLDSTP